MPHTHTHTHTSDFVSPLSVFSIPASILELIFWWWTFLSLLATLAQVRMRGQVAKEALYRKFLYCLVFTAVVSFAVMMLQVCVTHARARIHTHT